MKFLSLVQTPSGRGGTIVGGAHRGMRANTVTVRFHDNGAREYVSKTLLTELTAEGYKEQYGIEPPELTQ